ncbi:MAG: hypothetical protein QOI62_3028 [Solirubrobacteraceae bacterium]|jgi:SAM-dependent methyltransferase|nr:hypothetical protein [Solirubrobacteraceae bacterium]MEA2359768.1 hypothetical protein [Solirubrobacteraceae bacterium]
MTTQSQSLVDDIVGYYGGFFGTWLIAIGRQSGILEALRDHGEASPQELAERLGYAESYVATWCRGAYAFKLVDHSAGRFSLPAEAATVLLDSTNPSFMGGRGEFFSMLRRDFEMFPERMADGAPYPMAERPAQVADTMQAATLPDAPNAVANVFPQLAGLEDALRGGGRILDAGCMLGGGLATFAEAFPEAELVGIDAVQRFIDGAGSRLGSRATVRRMDVREMPYEDEFDLVWCNIALSHTWGADPEVIEALKRALKPGGWLVVSDVPHPATVEDLRSPSGRMFVGVTMYVSLLGPGLLTQDELLEKLGAGGFRQVVLADQPARTRMMVGAQKA